MADKVPRFLFIVLFENESMISIVAESKHEAAEIVLKGLEKLTGKSRDVFKIVDVFYCH